MKRFPCLLAALAAAMPVLSAAPLPILAIGDSMTEEYTFETPFSAPDASPSTANVHNWTELLSTHRTADFTFGTYKPNLLDYSDLRDAGYERNFGIPGFTSTNWVNILNTTNPFNFPSGSNDPFGAAYYPTRAALINELPSAQVIVILLGANDLKQDYNDIFNNTESPTFFTDLVQRLNGIYAWVKVRRNVPVVFCTVPDVGATPDVSSTYNDPAKIATTRAKIATMNASIVALAQSHHETVARLDLVTNRVFDDHPLQLNGTVFSLTPDPQNAPDHVFCKDGFHPATMAQALIANEIIGAVNAAKGSSISTFSNREILSTLLGFNPDKPYLDWATAHGVSSDPAADPDGDGLTNLMEYLLGSSPTTAGSVWSSVFAPGAALSWTPDPVAARYADLLPEESADLQTWTAIPAARVTAGADGSVQVSPAPGAASGYFRLRTSVKP